MGSVVVDDRAIEAQLVGVLVPMLDGIGQDGKAFVMAHTPVLSGYARRSIYYVVLDDRGNIIAGDTVDGNGVPVPRSFPGSGDGTYRVIVGANAPYYIWIEIGANGRPGRQALAQASERINERIRQLGQR